MFVGRGWSSIEMFILLHMYTFLFSLWASVCAPSNSVNLLRVAPIRYFNDNDI